MERVVRLNNDACAMISNGNRRDATRCLVSALRIARGFVNTSNLGTVGTRLPRRLHTVCDAKIEWRAERRACRSAISFSKGPRVGLQTHLSADARAAECVSAGSELTASSGTVSGSHFAKPVCPYPLSIKEDVLLVEGRSAADPSHHKAGITSSFCIIYNLSLLTHHQAAEMNDLRRRSELAQKALTLYKQAQMMLMHFSVGEIDTRSASFLPVVALTVNVAHVYMILGLTNEAFANYQNSLIFLASISSSGTDTMSVQDRAMLEHLSFLVHTVIQGQRALAAGAA